MEPISYKGHRFPPDVIRQAVWLYFRFTLSLRDVEELLAQRGIDVRELSGKPSRATRTPTHGFPQAAAVAAAHVR